MPAGKLVPVATPQPWWSIAKAEENAYLLRVACERAGDSRRVGAAQAAEQGTFFVQDDVGP